ncbi:prepilin-type N-terminal cleavage/methylation domain-containing protein [Sulfurimonas sp. HSL-3221]|uniref:prepilin-type N-terminal cleavage/methylation domain-containing protein n=1 Tax=Sulfurimonadaceae TaxID=2771471 RepID=UPI001E598F3E|nr:prepilin-type N-terminal cleavage/methylation domain-containing protein [Sulfurimonas sp. HSL-3221]UFS62158.1 prepilin-type N-terminal cleavage/methylation domain-containing protein [Sulfurimonas sp. HSL-3221]
MRPAFTLVEVLAAVAIAAIAGAALLKMNSSNLFFLGQLEQTSRMTEDLAVASLHADKRFHRSDKTLYDLLRDSYTIENDDLRAYLKSQQFRYTETLVDTISFDTGMLTEGAETGKEFGARDIEAAGAVPPIQFELIQVTLSAERRHGSMLTIRPISQ